MAKTIAIQIEVDGAKQAVKTIGELETAIEQLTEELKETEIGSERFQQLTGELNEARSALKTFEQTFEGLDPQQQTAAYLAFGESVVSGILLAQEALRSFGVENEQVNNAVEKSTQAINLALQARIVIEGVLEARILATALAQRALNTATVAGNKVLKALFTTMAANPVGALLAVIGLLVTAFIALSESTDDSTKSFAENAGEQKNLEIQSYATRRALKALSDETETLLKQYEDFNLSQATEELATLNAELESLTESQSTVRDFGQSFSELGNDILNGVTSLSELNLTLAEQELLLEAAAQGYERYVGVYQSEQVEQNIKSLEALIKALENSISESSGATDELQKRIDFLNKRIEDLKKSASTKALDDFKDALSDTADEVDRLNRNLLEFVDTPEPEIIESLKELLELQVQLRETAEENRKTLGDVFTEYFDDVEKASGEVDTFGTKVDEVRETLTESFLTGDLEEFGKTLNEIQEDFLSEENVDKFTEEQRKAITQILSGYEVAFSSLQQLGIETEDEFNTIVLPLLDGLTNKLQLEGKINFEEVNGTIEEFQLKFENIEEGTVQFYEKRQELIDEIARTQLEQVKLEALSAEDRKKAQEEATKLAEEQADAIIDIITNTAAAEDAIRGVLFTTQELTDEIGDTSNDFDELFGLIIDNFDKIEDEFDLEKLLTPDPTALQANLNAITKFLKEVSDGAIDLEQFTQEQREEILKEFLKRREDLLKENQETELVIIQETVDNYLAIGQSIQGLGQALAENTQYQVERIQQNTSELLDQVVGDSEEAVALRQEIEEDAAREIGIIQKESRLRELRLTQLQAVADAASAIINALKLPPPFGAIAAGIVGAATSIQLAVIQSQIQDTQALEFAQGGLVEGPGTGTSDSIPALLSNGEYVINARATEKFLPILEQINNQNPQQFSQGGFVLGNNLMNTIATQQSFDDSRIVAALENNQSIPVRAYVFEKDMTNAQQIEKRLQELSKL
jgi:hypothetical protein